MSCLKEAIFSARAACKIGAPSEAVISGTGSADEGEGCAGEAEEEDCLVCSFLSEVAASAAPAVPAAAAVAAVEAAATTANRCDDSDNDSSTDDNGFFMLLYKLFNLLHDFFAPAFAEHNWGSIGSAPS